MVSPAMRMPNLIIKIVSFLDPGARPRIGLLLPATFQASSSA